MPSALRRYSNKHLLTLVPMWTSNTELPKFHQQLPQAGWSRAALTLLSRAVLLSALLCFPDPTGRGAQLAAWLLWCYTVQNKWFLSTPRHGSQAAERAQESWAGGWGRMGMHSSIDLKSHEGGARRAGSAWAHTFTPPPWQQLCPDSSLGKYSWIRDLAHS